MIGAMSGPAACCHYEMEIAIDAPPQRVWNAIFEETQNWWLPEFHVAGAGSTISFDPNPGGKGIMEVTGHGGSLQWYTVQMHLPEQFKIYLVGYIAPEWGGPMTSHLMLAVEPSGSGSVLRIADARNGNVDEQHVQSYKDGWNQLFSDGLKAYIEAH